MKNIQGQCLRTVLVEVWFLAQYLLKTQMAEDIKVNINRRQQKDSQSME